MGRGSAQSCAGVAVVTRGVSTRAAALLPAEAAAELLHRPDNQARLAAMGRSLIVDMDDTLISNQILFDHSAKALAPIYADLDPLGRSPEELRKLHQAIDHDNIEPMGYTPARWMHSAQQAATEFAGRPLEATERERVLAAANIAMGVGEVLPGVERSLEALNKAGVTMLLKTKGCKDKQAEKLAAHRFDRFFGDRIIVVDRKDAATFRQVASKFGLQRPISIGDSERSDIEPAINSGFDGVLIDRGAEAWSFEATGSDVDRVQSFPQALGVVLDKHA